MPCSVHVCVAWKEGPAPSELDSVESCYMYNVATKYTAISQNSTLSNSDGRGLLFSRYWHRLAITSMSMRSLAASSTITDYSVLGPRYTNCYATYLNAGYLVARFTSFSQSRAAHVALRIY